MNEGYERLKIAVVVRALKDYLHLRKSNEYYQSAKLFLFSERLVMFTDIDVDVLIKNSIEYGL